MPPKYTVRSVGRPNTGDHRMFIESDGDPISPFHDIPLYANSEKTILNMIVEIPRWTQKKYEISRTEVLNPIKQDTKNGKLRYVKNCYPFKGYIWNYGALPQTWEDPSFAHPETKHRGDNDPVDALEIGSQVAYTGQVKQVKVLGIMALLDDEETDWKVVVVDVNDPKAGKLHDIEDVEKEFPGLYAMDVLEETAKAWNALVKGEVDRGEISITNISVEGSPERVKDPKELEIPPAEDLDPAAPDPHLDGWVFLSDTA
ncbi:hypothetical protein EG329_011628 [Mollisiaceae sp. DMI_Dod_QoI]|nr:hypothetical protein EG329_011628 [Helotiales sp. DMI_Dod_QoI]